jgi:hypothetical protein
VALVRDGRRVKQATAELCLDDGTVVARADALAIQKTPLELPASLVPAAPLPPRPAAECTTFSFPFFLSKVGYHTAMEGRVAEGTFAKGPTQTWMRVRGQVVSGEEPSPLERVLCAADSTNGVSIVLPVDRYTFINPDLTVVLARPLSGVWVCLDAGTTPAAQGTGLADSRLWDERGILGRAVQTLVVAARQDTKTPSHR